MSELNDLLDRTTPTALEPFDLDRAQRTARSRTRRTRSLAGLASVAVLAVGGIALTTSLGSGVDGPPTPDVLAPRVDAATFGSWRELGGWPLEPRRGVDAQVLADGRVLFLGGAGASVDGNANAVRTDGAIFDPVTEEWEVLPSAPGARADADALTLSSDLGPVVVSSSIPAADIAVYDLEAAAWRAIPPVPGRPALDLRGWGVAGTTIAVVLPAGSADEHLLAADPSGQPDWTGAEVEVWRYDVASDEGWVQGAAIALPPRLLPEVATSGARIAFYGGFRAGGRTVPARGGAAYDIASDVWIDLGDLGIMGNDVALAWLSPDDLGVAHADRDPASNISRPQAWTVVDVVNGQRHVTPRLPAAEYTSRPRVSFGQPAPLVAAPFRNNAPNPTFAGRGLLYDMTTRRYVEIENPGSGWARAAGDAGWWLTSLAGANPGDEPFKVGFVQPDGTYQRFLDAPFVNRLDAAIAVTEDRLYVLGGHAGGEIALRGDLWVFERAAG